MNLARPAFAFCEFNVSDAKVCLQAIGRGILLASWLAGAARQELARFREFMAWLRYGKECIDGRVPVHNICPEITRSTQNESHSHPPPRFDILQVNEYMMSGLVDSQIDKWFLGPVPKFSAEDFSITGPKANLEEVLERARRVANDPAEIAWRHVRAFKLNLFQGFLSQVLRTLSARI
jgi:anaphase-promoting complex subunit 4